MGVGVHGKVDVAVAYQFLGYAGRDAVAGQQGGERASEAVDVEGAALGVAFGDTGGGEVQVEGSQEVATQVEQRGIRCDLTTMILFQLGHVCSQVVHGVRPQGQGGETTSLGQGLLPILQELWSPPAKIA